MKNITILLLMSICYPLSFLLVLSFIGSIVFNWLPNIEGNIYLKTIVWGIPHLITILLISIPLTIFISKVFKERVWLYSIIMTLPFVFYGLITGANIPHQSFQDVYMFIYIKDSIAFLVIPCLVSFIVCKLTAT